jgi:Mrp family chromosome partitioning ATPase
MSDKRRTFTRKSRPRLDADERARLIAEIAAQSNGTVPETFDLPHVQDPTEDVQPPAQTPVEDTLPEAELLTDDSGLFDAAMMDNQPPAAPDDVHQPDAEPEAEPVSQTKSEPTAPAIGSTPAPADIWAQLGSIPVDPAHLERNLIITAGRHDPAHGAFDVLRTRLMQTLYENDWKRVAITSPTRDCGKTFTAVNLAISLSRYETNRTVLMDMDMRNPSLAQVIGAPDPGSMGNFLQGNADPSTFFKRLGRNALNIGANLAVGLNNRIEPYAAELIQDPHADAAFARMMQEMDPDVVLYDLPPALAYDDVIAFKKHFDGILMVIGGGATKAEEIHEAMRRIGEDVPLLGVVLNQAESNARLGYTYGY